MLKWLKKAFGTIGVIWKRIFKREEKGDEKNAEFRSEEINELKDDDRLVHERYVMSLRPLEIDDEKGDDKDDEDRAEEASSQPRYREATLEVEDADNFVRYFFSEGEEDILVRVTEDTTLLGVDAPGEYRCIYRFDKRRVLSRGRFLCVVDPKTYERFAVFTDLREKARHIGTYAVCSPEQRLYMDRVSRRPSLEDERKDPAVWRTAQREIIDDPDALVTMFSLCEHTMPHNLRCLGRELVNKVRKEGSGKHCNILIDLLYSCLDDQVGGDMHSTEECLAIFRSMRHGEDPWVKDMIRQLRLISRCKDKGSVFVLVGPPGVGKTAIAHALAECTRRKLSEIKCSNKNATDIGGLNKIYVDATSGLIMEAIRNYGPRQVMLLDEWNNMVANDKDGNPFKFFDSVFDDRKYFVDRFDQFNAPTKDIIFILAVNDIKAVPAHIVDRFSSNIFYVDGYSSETKAEIGRKFLVPKQMKEYGFTEEEVEFTESGLLAIARATNDSGARQTEQHIRKMLGLANEQLAEGAVGPIIVDAEYVTDAAKKAAKTYGDRKRSIGFSA